MLCSWLVVIYGIELRPPGVLLGLRGTAKQSVTLNALCCSWLGVTVKLEKSDDSDKHKE
jgi:hypothetical protein